MTRVLGVVVVCATLEVVSGFSRTVTQPAQPARTITGRVIADDTSDPLHNARVSLSPSAQGTPVVLSDADGAFTITVPTGRYSIVASKTGYGRREVAATPGERVEIRLMRSAAISGRVVDEVGDPVPSARILAGTSISADNKLAGGVATETDDRGEYRIGGL